MPNSLAQQLRHLVEDPRLKDAGDADLLRRFTADRDQAAFKALVDRHGPMVLHVCRCVLRDDADIEDAFQATFVILARKAQSIRKTGSLSCWLHGVAHRTALKALRRSGTRRKHEANAPVRDATASDDLSWREVQAILHEEVETLPERYRCPLVLCYLEGKTQEQAATLLGLVKGTLRRRLDRARELLRGRLVRRGLGPAALALAVTWPGMHASGAVPAALVASTVRAAGLLALGQTTAQAASAAVAGLVDGVLHTMAMTKVKAAAAALTVALLLGVVGTAVVDGLPPIAAAPGLPAGALSGPKNPAADPAKSAPDAGGQAERTLELEEPVRRLRWTHDGSLIVSFSSREEQKDGRRLSWCTFRFWDGATGKLKQSLGEVENQGVQSFGFSPDGKRLAVSMRKGIDKGDCIEVYDVATGNLGKLIEFDYGRSRVWFAFSPDSKQIAVCGSSVKNNQLEGAVRLFDVDTGQLKRTLAGGSMTISVAFSADGKRLAAGGYKGDITIWDLAAGKVAKTLESSAAVAALAFSPDGKHIVSGGSAPITLWDLGTGKSTPLADSQGGHAFAEHLVFSPDGRFIAGEGGLVKDEKALKKAVKGGGLQGAVELQRLSATVRLWNVRRAEFVREWTGTQRSCAFSPDSKRLSILHDEKTIKVWELPGGTTNGPLDGPGAGRAAPTDREATHGLGQAVAGADGPGPAKLRREPSATVARFVAHLKKPRLRRFAGEQTLGLFLMDLEKHDVTLIAADADDQRAYCGSPTWSCDGRRILFDASPGMAFGKTRLQMLELTDAGPGLSSFGPGNCPTISPDGKRIAYLLNPGALANAEPGIYVMDADGTNRRLLARASGVPKWSPQGNKLLIADFNNPTKLTLLDVDTAEQSTINFRGRIYSRPSWVDEQTLVAFIGEAKTMSVALLDVRRPDEVRVKKVLWKRGDGSNVEPLYPVYSPVTKQCVFVGREKGVQALYRLDRNGRPQRMEANEQRDGKIASLALSPDGRYLLFCSDRAFSSQD